MTVSSETSKVVLSGDGANKSFPFGFKIFLSDDLEVRKTDSVGVETVVSSSNYSVTINGESGGTVTYPTSGAALAANEKLTLARKPAMTQTFDFTNQGAFLAQNHEDAFDKVVMMALELKEESDRSFKKQISDESGASLVLPDLTSRANKTFNFDANGDLQLTELGSIEAVSGSISSINTVAADLNGGNTIGAVAADLSGSDTVGAAATLVNAGSPGFPSIASAGTVNVRSITAGTGIGVSNGNGVSANPAISLSHLGLESLTDPGADRILFWDDSANVSAWGVVGNGLSLTGTTLATNDSAIDHDVLANFVADEHVAHSGVSIIAGAGLTGGGTIETTRTLNVGAGTGIVVAADAISLSHLGLEGLTGQVADRVAFWDASASAFGWLTMGSGLTLTGTTLTSDVQSVSGKTGAVVLGTDDVAEASNLYFTNARADARVSNAVGLTVQAWDTDLDTYAANPLTAAELGQLQNIGATTISAGQWGYLGGAGAYASTLLAPINEAAFKAAINAEAGVDFLAYDANLQGFVAAHTLPTSGGTSGQVLATDGAGAVTWKSVVATGTIATQDANSVSITGGSITGINSLGVSGDLDIGGKFTILQPGATAADTLTAIHAARDALSTGGTIMLAPGKTFTINGDINMSVDGQTLHIPDETTLVSDGSTRRAIRVTGEDCTVCGNGELDKVSVNIGSYSIVGEGLGARVLGNLKFVDTTSRAIDVADAYSATKPILIEGAYVYWTASGVAAAKTVLPLNININTFAAAATGQNVHVRNCVVDYSAWSEKDLAELQYPSSNNPNAIGIRIRANNESVFKNWTVDGCRVIMPIPTATNSWDPTTYGNAADGAGGRRPTCFEITAIRATINYTSKSGTFSSGETVTGGTSGATCIVDTDSTTSFTSYNEFGCFKDGETLTGGTSGATAIFASRVGHLQNGKFSNNTAIGGDLQFSFGKGHDISFDGNRATGDCTSYCVEYAGGELIYGSGNLFDSRLAGKAVSCTNTRNVVLPGSYIRAGKNTTGVFSTSNTGISCEGINRIDLSGSTIVAGADGIDLMRIRTTSMETVINLTGTTWAGTGYSTINGVRFDQGVAHTINLTGANFYDIDTNSILIDSGQTLDQLITIGCAGFNAGAYTNNGTVTTHVDGFNVGISGLSAGASGALLAANNLSDLASASTARTNLGLGTIATQAATSVNIDGGAIDGTAIGATSRAAGYFSVAAVGTSSTSDTFEVKSAGNTTSRISSTFSNSTATGLIIDTTGDGSTGRIVFSKAGTSRGIFKYAHSASGVGEIFSVNVAGGTDELQIRGDSRATLFATGAFDYNGLYVGGVLAIAPGTSVTPQNNGDVVIEATNNTTLTFKLKGSDGTVRSGTLALS